VEATVPAGTAKAEVVTALHEITKVADIALQETTKAAVTVLLVTTKAAIVHQETVKEAIVHPETVKEDTVHQVIRAEVVPDLPKVAKVVTDPTITTMIHVANVNCAHGKILTTIKRT